LRIIAVDFRAALCDTDSRICGFYACMNSSVN
jgi:hypothetical protein